ncbi:MAG: M56 family metallopeptidase, partial [Candidatus Alkaliphilus sp. MAG34]
RCVCLVLHWYNPLVWMAAFYSMKDAELSCDEATIRLIGEDKRMEYGRTIIGLTCTKDRMDKLLMTATTMTGSKKSIEERITLIAKKPKTTLYISVIVFLAAVIAVGCTFTGARMNGVEKRSSQPEIEDRDEYIYVAEPELPKEMSYPDNGQWEQTFAGFTSDKEGWFVGSPGVALGTSENYVYLTYDGGKTWKEIGNVNNEWSRVLTAAAFADTNTGYLCFRYDIENIGRVYQTKDGGKTWKQLEIPIFATLVEDGVGEVRSIGFDGNKNGKMEFYFRNRNNETREGAIQTLISKDKGQTWSLLPENQGIQEAGRADINGDGRDEYIYLDNSRMNEGLATLSVGDVRGNELWSEQLSTSHAGWGQLFLCELDGRQYLLRYNPAMFQGNTAYVYTLFTLKDGKEKVFKTNSVEFDINGTKELDVPQMLSFANEINSLLTKSTLLISSNNGAFL